MSALVVVWTVKLLLLTWLGLSVSTSLGVSRSFNFHSTAAETLSVDIGSYQFDTGYTSAGWPQSTSITVGRNINGCASLRLNSSSAGLPPNFKAHVTDVACVSVSDGVALGASRSALFLAGGINKENMTALGSFISLDSYNAGQRLLSLDFSSSSSSASPTIAPISASFSFAAVEILSNGQVYGLTSSPSIAVLQINPSTGATSPLTTSLQVQFAAVQAIAQGVSAINRDTSSFYLLGLSASSSNLGASFLYAFNINLQQLKGSQLIISPSAAPVAITWASSLARLLVLTTTGLVSSAEPSGASVTAQPIPLQIDAGTPSLDFQFSRLLQATGYASVDAMIQIEAESLFYDDASSSVGFSLLVSSPSSSTTQAVYVNITIDSGGASGLLLAKATTTSSIQTTDINQHSIIEPLRSISLPEVISIHPGTVPQNLGGWLNITGHNLAGVGLSVALSSNLLNSAAACSPLIISGDGTTASCFVSSSFIQSAAMLSFDFIVSSFGNHVELVHTTIDIDECTANPCGGQAQGFSICQNRPYQSPICSCIAGFYSPGAATGAACQACAADTYKDTVGNAACTKCPVHSTTQGLLQRSSISQCVCDSGFKEVDSTDGSPFRCTNAALASLTVQVMASGAALSGINLSPSFDPAKNYFEIIVPQAMSTNGVSILLSAVPATLTPVASTIVFLINGVAQQGAQSLSGGGVQYTYFAPINTNSTVVIQSTAPGGSGDIMLTSVQMIVGCPSGYVSAACPLAQPSSTAGQVSQSTGGADINNNGNQGASGTTAGAGSNSSSSSSILGTIIGVVSGSAVTIIVTILGWLKFFYCVKNTENANTHSHPFASKLLIQIPLKEVEDFENSDEKVARYLRMVKTLARAIEHRHGLNPIDLCSSEFADHSKHLTIIEDLVTVLATAAKRLKDGKSLYLELHSKHLHADKILCCCKKLVLVYHYKSLVKLIETDVLNDWLDSCEVDIQQWATNNKTKLDDLKKSKKFQLQSVDNSPAISDFSKVAPQPSPSPLSQLPQEEKSQEEALAVRLRYTHEFAQLSPSMVNVQQLPVKVDQVAIEMSQLQTPPSIPPRPSLH